MDDADNVLSPSLSICDKYQEWNYFMNERAILPCNFVNFQQKEEDDSMIKHALN